jgi:perosamine synthetase
MPMSEACRGDVTSAVMAYLDAAVDDPAVTEQHILGTGATRAIEQKMRRHFGMPYAVACCNATSGLLAAELALGLRGSEIITSSLVYGASLSGALFLGNRCSLADVDGSMNLSADAVRRCVRTRTKAILALDFNGVPADMEALRHVADEFGLWYIADAAQSFGAKWNRRPAGSLADVLVTSFTCGKSLFAGEGAVVLTRHREVYERLLWHTQHPCRQRRELGLHLFNEFSLNFRIHPLAATWANAAFEPSLQNIRVTQGYWLGVLSVLEHDGLIECYGYSKNRICPSFFRAVVRLRGNVKVADIRTHVAKSGLKIDAQPLTLLPVYRNPSALAQYERHFLAHCCPNAEILSQGLVVLSRISAKEESCKIS